VTLGCKQDTKKEKPNARAPLSIPNKNLASKAESLVTETINAHGGDLYDNAHYSFTFRDKTYSFKNSNNSYRYTVTSIKNSDTISDILENEKLTRSINGKVVELSKKDDAKYTEALNSVLYFATFPHKLKDKAE